MKERPIQFSAPMVRAILAGRKTQTRRIVSPQPDSNINPVWIEEHECWQWATVESRRTCPFGKPGDRLWVREKFAYLERNAAALCNPRVERRYGVSHGQELAIVYATDATKLGWDGPWKPSIHMPRWASRITLEVTGVKVERVQDISEADASAEGLERLQLSPDYIESIGRVHPMTSTYREAFAKLWDEINGPGAWERNDWCWCVSFKRVPQEGKATCES